MTRLLATLAALSILGLAGCEQPQKKADNVPDPPPTSESAEEPAGAEEATPPDEADDEAEATESPEAGDTATAGQEGAEAEDTEPSAESEACPEAREPSGMCAQVITWAKNPDTGTCCEYPTPCHAPKDWKTFSSEDECGG